MRNRDWKDQVTIYEATVKTNPQSAALRNDLGIVYFQYGELVKSRESFEKAIAMNPRDPHFYFSAEETYSALEQYDKTIECLNKAIELKPDFPEAYFNLAGIHAYLNKETQAREYLAKAVDMYRQEGRILEAGEAIKSMEKYFSRQQAQAKLGEESSPDDVSQEKSAQ